ALETGRWVVQVAPTGFSAFVTPSGRVLDRTGVSEEAVASRTVERRRGDTWYVILGDKPVVAAALGVLALALVLERRDRRTAPGDVAPEAASSDLEPDRDGAVVDELDGHLGA